MGDPDEAFARAGVLFDEGRYEEAFAAYGEVVAADPTRARAIGAQARCLSALARHDEAIALATRAVEVDVAQPYAHVALIVALHSASRPEPLIAAVGEAEGVAFSQIQRGSIQAMLAYAYVELDQIDHAYAAASKSVELAPESAMAHCALASALGLQNRMGPALAAIERAVAIEPTDAFYADRRDTLRKGVEILEGALAEARARLDGSPSADAWSDVGALLDLLGRYREAATAFEQAIAIDPAHVAAWTGKGWALHREGGRFPEDVLAFQKADELGKRKSKRAKKPTKTTKKSAKKAKRR
ncbi:MAG: tetratricopeptide repeat protein [Kofleriaceae bacterium]|nr:tetratricopeptide repeat protein [Kofleriaceae bacterium]